MVFFLSAMADMIIRTDRLHRRRRAAARQNSQPRDQNTASSGQPENIVLRYAINGTGYRPRRMASLMWRRPAGGQAGFKKLIDINDFLVQAATLD
jgi:hypothetical protein